MQYHSRSNKPMADLKINNKYIRVKQKQNLKYWKEAIKIVNYNDYL